MADTSSWTLFWNDPIDGLKAILSPSATPTSSVFGDSLNDARIRAYGVDPNTGKLIAPQYAASASLAGYDPSNPQAFLDSVSNQVQTQYDSEFAAGIASMNLFPSLPDLPTLPDLAGLSPWLVIAVLVVVAFLIIEAVK